MIGIITCDCYLTYWTGVTDILIRSIVMQLRGDEEDVEIDKRSKSVVMKSRDDEEVVEIDEFCTCVIFMRMCHDPGGKKNLVNNVKATFPNCDPSNQSQLHETVSESLVLGEQLGWLDDLLGDYEPGLKFKSHRRASSDFGTVLNGVVEFEKDDKNESQSSFSSSSLESGCIYRPNSPRSKDKVSSIQETDELNMEAKPFKRHSAQRSRVRKLMYIAELETIIGKIQVSR
uniref:Uncharacterized protein n=1 Tax=Lactuca sativa TaxID=4236 RepID=A0A9R1V925_LACSA|nr:hypothetical protein LSAT_V11C600324130 [Lactuca sativa]